LDRGFKHMDSAEKIGGRTMSNVCRFCQSTELQATANAKALGLEQEFEGGIYTCCQMAKWADEQSSAWLEAAHADDEPTHDLTNLSEPPQTDAALVPVRLRRTQNRDRGYLA
jgi:hypothetical protein